MKNKGLPVFCLFLFVLIGTQIQAQNTVDSTRKPVYINSDFTNFQGKLLDLIKADSTYSIFFKLITVGGLEPMFSQSPALTVFAPANEAFVQLPTGQLDSLYAHPEQASTLVKQHIVMGLNSKQDISNKLKNGTNTWMNLNQQVLKVFVDANRNMVIEDTTGTQTKVSDFDKKASNGIVQGVNKVLFP